jgi:phospholipid/cholesterol/gamma-HCH transport system substrate-binding protein
MARPQWWQTSTIRKARSTRSSPRPSLRSRISRLSRRPFSGQDDRIIALVDDVRAAANAFTTTLNDADAILKAVKPEQVTTIVDSVASVTGGLSDQKGSIDEMILSARNAAANVEKITDDLSKRTPDVDQIITDAKEMTSTLNATSVRIQGIVDKVGTMVEGDGEGLIVEATKAATAIRKVAVAFESRADSIASGLSKFANQGSSDFSAAMSQVNRTLVSIQRAVESFDRNPNRIIFGGEGVPTYSGGRRR